MWEFVRKKWENVSLLKKKKRTFLTSFSKRDSRKLGYRSKSDPSSFLAHFSFSAQLATIRPEPKFHLIYKTKTKKVVNEKENFVLSPLKNVLVCCSRKRFGKALPLYILWRDRELSVSAISRQHRPNVPIYFTLRNKAPSLRLRRDADRSPIVSQISDDKDTKLNKRSYL